MNQTEKVLIVGGGPAGLSAARAYRNSGGRGEVKILSGDELAPYERPALTKEYLRGEKSRADLPLEAEDWYRENAVELRLGVRVESLDLKDRAVETAGGETLRYDRLVLATGSDAMEPPFPVPESGVYLVRSIADADALRKEVSGEARRVVVVGSGFIGCEAAASLAMLGCEVELVSLEEAPQKERLGEPVSERIAGWLHDLGVKSRFGRVIERVVRRDGSGDLEARIEGGESVPGELFVLGTGARARTELAEQAGLSVEGGGVVCDASLKTSDESVFACGDIAFAYNEAAERRLRVEHWGDALAHGRTAGETIAGRESALRAVPGFWSTIGDKTIKYAAWGDGWDEERFVDRGDGAFTVWYGREGACVGVLTHKYDEDYERGRKVVEAGGPLPG